MQTAHEMAVALSEGSISAVELVKRSISAAAASPSVFIKTLFDEALIDAEASDKRRAMGKPLSSFDGVPYVAKDLFDVRGTVTTAGSLTRIHSKAADEDADIIARLQSHGLVLIGKTNLSEFAFSGLGLNPHFGTPTPHYDPLRAPGGSSSGTAIAIERGIVAFGLGTDTAGSMRVPAAFNNLVGFRPSQGRYNPQGIYPLAASFDVPGPMAKTMEDCVALDQLMGGQGVGASEHPPIFLLELSTLADPALDSEVRANLLAFVERIKGKGARVEEASVSAVERTRKLITDHGWLGGYEAAQFHQTLLDSPARADVDKRVVARLDGARSMSGETAKYLAAQRLELMDDIRSELRGRILLLPTTPNVAPILEPLEQDASYFAQVNLQTLSLTMVTSFLDMPALAFPSGFDSLGAPTSVTLTATNKTDTSVLGVGLWVERECFQTKRA